MPVRFFALAVVAVAAFDVCSASTAQAPGVGNVPRSLEMAISKNEMIGADGGLQARAILALQRMNALAQAQGVELTIQIPADAIDAAAEIERVAPSSVIKQVAERRPFKLMVRTQGQHNRPRVGQDHGAGAVASAERNGRKYEFPHVYIHVRDENQLKSAREHALQLRQLGAYVPELEIFVAEGPRRKQLRYFHAQDRNEAKMLARGLSGGAEPELLDLSREYGVSVPARRYELWLPPTPTGQS